MHYENIKNEILTFHPPGFRHFRPELHRNSMSSIIVSILSLSLSRSLSRFFFLFLFLLLFLFLFPYPLLISPSPILFIVSI